MQKQLTAIIEREEKGYVSFCPEVDIASQGNTIEEARENLREALELVLDVRRELAEEQQAGRPVIRENIQLAAA